MLVPPRARPQIGGQDGVRGFHWKSGGRAPVGWRTAETWPEGRSNITAVCVRWRGSMAGCRYTPSACLDSCGYVSRLPRSDIMARGPSASLEPRTSVLRVSAFMCRMPFTATAVVQSSGIEPGLQSSGGSAARAMRDPIVAPLHQGSSSDVQRGQAAPASGGRTRLGHHAGAHAGATCLGVNWSLAGIAP